MEYGKDYDTVLSGMKERIKGDVSTNEGTLAHFALAPAAAEIEELYNNLEVADENGSALTCDREHLIIKGQEDNIPIKRATAAIWIAQFNEDFDIGERFECGDLTYISTQRITAGRYTLQCETLGIEGNTKPEDELLAIEFISETIEGELVELIQPATDDEDTEVYRQRYLAEKKIDNNPTGNRSWYTTEITGIAGVAAVKLERVTQQRRRIDAYIMSSDWGVPSADVVALVQNTIDPLPTQGDGDGSAPFWHVVDIHPVEATEITIGARITLQSGVRYEDIKEDIKRAIDALFIELNKTWQNENYLTVRALRVAEAIGAVQGVVDVQDLTLNGVADNMQLGSHAIPVRRGDLNVN